MGTVIGQGTAMRETIIGRLHTADRGRAAVPAGDRAAFDAAYAEGLRDPLAVLAPPAPDAHAARWLRVPA